MSTSFLVILIFTSSFAGAVFLVGYRIFSIREMDTEELCKELISCDPFFEDFSGVLNIFKKVLGGLIVFCLFLKKRFDVNFLRKYLCHFSNFIHGRHSVEKNGCQGYWKKLNAKSDKNK